MVKNFYAISNQFNLSVYKDSNKLDLEKYISGLIEDWSG